MAKIGFNEPEDELKAIDLLCQEFAKKMKEKLYKKYNEGAQNWEKPSEIPFMYDALDKNVTHDSAWSGISSQNLVDIANLAMLLWNHTEE